MKDKPQMIKANVDSGFLPRYVEMIIPAIKRKFSISIGIEGELFMNPGGVELTKNGSSPQHQNLLLKFILNNN
jgi:hypothetical protein